MQKFKPVSHAQCFLLPPSVEDFIKEDHLARVISEVVDSLDTSVIEKKYSHLGQKSFPPKLMLKVLFYGYSTGMRSGRKMATACESDVAFMYLSSMYRPDFRTLNDFRKNNITRVEQFFVEVIRLCAAMNMVNIGTLAIDSTRIKASASLRRTHTKQQYQQWLSQIEERVKDVTAEADLTDQQEDASYGKDKRGDELPKEINTREKLKRKIKEVLEEMKDEKEDSTQRMNLTDKEARVMYSGGTPKVGYNCQAASTASGVIVSAYVTSSASDKEHLLPLVQQAESNTKQVSDTILADSGYASYDNYEKLSELNKTILIPDQEKETEKRKAAANPYHRNHFRYDTACDQYICPEEKPLPYHSLCNNKTYKQQSRLYQGTQCAGCHVKTLCTKGKARQIHAETRMPLRQKIRQLLDSPSGKKLYKLRQQIIEPIFGNIKHNLPYTMMHLRTLTKTNAEWQLICLTHNIKKIWKAKWQPA